MLRLGILILAASLCAVSTAAGEEWVGKKMPDLRFPDRDGKIIELKGPPGSVTIIDVWASWCGPCKKYMPHVDGLKKTLGSYGVHVIGVNTDKKGSEQEVSQFLAEIKVSFPILYGPDDKISRIFGIDSIPRTLVIDDRQVVRFLGHPQDLDESNLLPMIVKQSREIIAAGESLPESDPRFWIRRGLMLNDNSPREAAFYLKAIGLDAKSAVSHRFLGVVYDDQEEYVKALEHLKLALEATPQDVALKHYTASVYVKAGKELDDNSDAEIEFYNHAIALNPSNSAALFAKAAVYEQRGDGLNAMANFREVLKLDPNSSNSRRRIGKLLVKDGKLDDAKAEFLILLKDSPEDLGSLQEMATICETQGQLKDAVHYYGQVTSLLSDRLTKIEMILSKLDR